MTRLCVSILVTDARTTQREIATAVEAGADMVELRIDRLTDANSLGELVVPVSCIVTCRPESEGGTSTLGAAERVALLIDSTRFLQCSMDLELQTVRAIGSENLSDGGWIVSTHDFQGRPDKLNNLLLEMNELPASVTKIVWHARSVRDNLEAFEILQSRRKPTIALCMGEAGLMSRVLAKKFGAYLSFAALTDSRITAPGQISIQQMRDLYRWEAIGRDTQVFGVIGSPVAHSMSPAVHNAAFDETGYDGVYLPLPVEASYESFKAFMETVARAPWLHMRGLSITLPHKQNAMRYLQEVGGQIDPTAARVGAVNTIVIDRSAGAEEPQFRGLNTDYSAIVDTVTGALGISPEELGKYRIGVIGAGGTGRTAVAALSHLGATVVIYNRTHERAQALAAEFSGAAGKVVAAPMAKFCDSCCQILINTTSVGMHPQIDETPVSLQDMQLDARTLVFDAIYNPPQTRFLREAADRGAKTVSGVEMFLHQAAAQFQAWTHQPAPLDVMRAKVQSHLGGGA